VYLRTCGCGNADLPAARCAAAVYCSHHTRRGGPLDVLATQRALSALIGVLKAIGAPFQGAVVMASVALLVVALTPPLRDWRGRALTAMAALLALGEGALAWFHWRLYQTAVVVVPDTGQLSGRIAVPLWIESEKLYVWALAVAVLGVLVRRHRNELLPGVMIATALLSAGAMLLGRPFTEPLPSFLGQYQGYLQAMGSGVSAFAQPAYQGIEGARQFYYNAWYMWVHPPLLFFAYGAFTISFVATVLMVARKHSSFEATSYRWARLGYLPLTVGMLLGFPWAILAWKGEAWWWSGKVNMSLMMWLLYTALLHARLYLRRGGMWRWVAALSVLSFAILILTYVTTYVVPGAHSYADAGWVRDAIASLVASWGGAS
jgi:hypothetical protein